MESVILAAGFSSRFDFKYKTFKKYLLPFKNSILMNYVIGGMVEADIEKINIVIDDTVNKQMILKSANNFIGKLKTQRAKVTINLVENHYPERENGYSLFLGAHEVSSDFFILSMADHIFSVNVYSELIKVHNDQDIILATDPMEIEGVYDLDDCTKVHGVDSKIEKIGKKIEKYNRLDMGAFIMKTDTIKQVSTKIEIENTKFGVSSILMKVMKSGREVCYNDFKNTLWIDIDNEIEYNKVKDLFGKDSNIHPFNLQIR